MVGALASAPIGVPDTYAASRSGAPGYRALVIAAVGPGSRGSRWAVEQAVSAAEAGSLGPGRPLVAEVDAEPRLGDVLGVGPREGLAEVLLAGRSLARTAVAVVGRDVHCIPAGLVPAGDALHSTAAWSRLIRQARRRGLTVLAFASSDETIRALAPIADGAILLGDPSEWSLLGDLLPVGTPVLGAFRPPSPGAAIDADPHESGTAGDPAEPPHSIRTIFGDETGDAPPAPADAEGVQAASGSGTSLAAWLAAEEERIRSEQAREPIDTQEAVDGDPEDPEPAPFRSLFSAKSTESADAEIQDPEERPNASLTAASLLAPVAPDVAAGEGRSDFTSKYSVPRTSERRERVIHVLAVVILAYWTYYILWRWTSTLNWDAAWFSIPLALAETWGLLSGYFLVFNTWKLQHRTPTPPAPDLSVDVFITTYDEPLEVIRRTAISAREIRYPHRTYVLDDGRRDEVRAMAQELGVDYIRREDNQHAKAGNLNNALAHTSGDFILQLDADHAPLPQILDRLLGFFDDRRVAFVQSPQDFYNTDSFTSEVDEVEKRIWEEQRLFFSVIQPGKDRWNAAFFCGSCAVIRRAALDEIGGFSTTSITEDIETSLLLHARGWRSVYYGESLAYGLAAGSAEAFHTQHSRWAQGAMQVLRRFNPLTFPGLTPAQRISYFYSLTAYVVGLQKLIFVASPILFFLTGVLPIRALDREFLTRFVPYLILAVTLIEMLSRGQGFTWIAERYHMAKFWTYTRALPVFFTKRRLRFRVTPKGAGTVPMATYMPHLLLLGIMAFSVNWATLAYHEGWVDYGVPGWRSLAFQLNFFWAAINFLLAGYVVRLSLRLHQHRQDHRFADRFPIFVRSRRSRGRLGERQIALTEDLNASGLSFRSVERFEPGSGLKLVLPLSTREVSVKGEVVHVRVDDSAGVTMHVHGVEFRNVPLDARDAIELHCAHHAVPIEQMKYQGQARVLARAQDWVRNTRLEPRRGVRLPARVSFRDNREPDGEMVEGVALLEEVSASGARLIMDRAVPPGTWITFEVSGTELRGEGHTVFSRALETPIGVRFAVGMRRISEREHDTPSRRKMRIPRLWRAAGAAAALLTVMAASPSALQAQVQAAIFGSAETDTEDLTLLLLGLSVHPDGLGLVPTAGVLGYRLDYPIGSNRNSLTAVVPSAGVRYQMPAGAYEATVGYLFLDGDTEGGFGAPGGAEEGVVTNLMADYWGMTGVRSAQAIVSYNWGDEYVWARGRAAQQVASVGTGAVRLGAEVVGQGGGGDASGAGYKALQFGPLLEFQPSPGFKLMGVVGAKSDNIADNPGLFPYFKVDFVVVP